jgi:RNA-binding protein 39
MVLHSSRNLSTDTLRTKRSHRSVSREREKRDRRRDKGEPDERKKRNHSQERGSERGYRDRSRDRHRDRDRDRRRDRDGDRGHRGSRYDDSNRHNHRDRDRDRDRDDKDRDRRRKRGDDFDGPERDHEERVKRKRSDAFDALPPPPTSLPPPPPRDSPRSVRSSDRRKGDRPFLDPRDEFDDSRSKKLSEDRHPIDDDDNLSMKSPPPPGVRCVHSTYPLCFADNNVGVVLPLTLRMITQWMNPTIPMNPRKMTLKHDQFLFHSSLPG